MTLLQVIVLALIQGLTEFLPVSSSAHLILGGLAFGWPDEGLVFDAATHLGTLIAVLIYFRRDLRRMVMACLRSPTKPEDVQQRRMVGLLVLASLPVLMIGFLESDFISTHLRDARVIAWATIIFGLVLWWADARGPKDLAVDKMTTRHALLIGLAQVLSLIPGTSRSGITITAGRLLGLNAFEAARFSFLLSIPVIAAAGAFGALRVWTGATAVIWSEFWLGAALAAIAGWICIAAFLALVKRIGLVPFVIYRLVLGVFLLWLTW
ncbi:MAG TPA: undecaprenyl-diphosphate phosphatase [Xanthomonadales bacterium]|nr:undecaprenyl-diphosphate phosphatase [Xanthomonadales bacterium]